MLHDRVDVIDKGPSLNNRWARKKGPEGPRFYLNFLRNASFDLSLRFSPGLR